MRRSQILGVGLLVGLAVLVVIGMWQRGGRNRASRIALLSHPRAVMGTDCSLVAVVASTQRERAEQSLRAAETVLRTTEARMSSWLSDSEISRLNAAGTDREIPLSASTLDVLRTARRATAETGGAFNVTCLPLIRLWERAGKRGALPTAEELAAARAVSQWKWIELREGGAIKHDAVASVSLGGIAKGYAIDQAVETLRQAKLAGGLVDVGGDLRCFGKPPSGRTWSVDVRNPFGQGRLLSFQLDEGAACTSGNYARFTEIEGRGYSHVIDPIRGRPAQAVPSVTVVADTAMTADIWATAISVLGREGLERLPEGVDALIILGVKDDYALVCTPGFQKLLDTPLPNRLSVQSAREPR